VRHRLGRLVGVRVGVVTGFRGLWALKSTGLGGLWALKFFLSSITILGVEGLGGLWALEWVWHLRVTNLRCVQGYGI